MKKVLVSFILSFVFMSNVCAQDLKLTESAKSSILMEASTGEIIHAKNENEKLAPASMTKIMSLILIMEEIEKGNLKLDEIITVSENASKMGGSQIYLEAGEKMSVDDLLKAICVGSANDAVVALSERIAGTEEAFVFRMNEKAKEMGLKNTNFKNATGLDTANHYSSAYDMAYMARELVRHKKILEYSGIYETYLRQNTNKKFWLVNTNKLIKTYDGMDGLKTGYTKEAGYCLTATAKRGDMRLISVAMGEDTSKIRNEEITKMLDYGFNTYKVNKFLTKNTKVGELKNDKSNLSKVNIVPIEDINVLNKKGNNKRELSYKLNITNNELPIKKGDIVGYLQIKENGNNLYKINVTVQKDLKKANILELLVKNIGEVFNGDNIF
ncbi:MAG: D-alanyl-D-alanine carboxypeptidase [Bacilli bacterium]|nr:D-alanyl-D-alanine carboxypeptidase [Bacilli bacterium]